MRQKTEQETNAAERQVTLLVDALENAKANGGVWLNADGHPRAKMYPNGVNVSPFNALVMGLHADANAYQMPLYLSFNTAKDNALSVRKGEKGVPFIWYNWDTFVNRENEEDKISRATYNALPESVRENYKAVQKREVRTLFNLDQTTFPHKEKEEYENLKKEYGAIPVSERNPEEIKTQVSHFILTMRDNLVPIEHANDLPHAQYDPKEDVILIPHAKDFARYEDFAQDIMRKVIMATGHEQRLARVSRPTPEAMRQEAFISELASGIRMAELGLPARISKENLQHIDFWKQELQENPCLIDTIERDVNRSLDLVARAERGEKIEYASKIRKDLVEKLSTPEINSQECAILLDVIRRDGEVDRLNFRSDNARKAFLEKFDLLSFETERQRLKAELCRPDISEVEKEEAKEALDKVSDQLKQKCIESMPEKWNDKAHNFFIYPEISKWVEKFPKTFGLVLDSKTKIADVILPSGANLKTGVPGTNTNERIAHALMKYKDASYVRFFNSDGFMAYKPDDNYFRNKEITYQEVKGWKVNETARMKFDDAVLKANTVVFDQAQMMKTDEGKWALYLKAHGEEGFAILPSAKDVNEFFTTIRHGDDNAINDLRHELSQKYYLIGKKNPKEQFDIFCMDAPKADVARISRVSIFRSKEGKLMIMPTIEDLGKQRPRELKQSQWQRMWLAPDMAAYKNHLAAKLFADVLHSKMKLNEGEKVTPLNQAATPSMEVPAKEEKEEKQQEETVAENDELEEDFIDQEEEVNEEEQQQAEEKKEEQKQDSKIALTPMVKQFLDLKKKHPDALLLFRCGDFYETYMQDAEKASKILGITLTKSTKTKGPDGKPLAMAGFPYHALDTYLPKLIRAGQRVAICDQIEAPKQTTKRGISEMVSPGAEMEKASKAAPKPEQEEEQPSRGFHR